MPLIDVKCQSETCGSYAEVYRPLREWPQTPACPSCGSATEQAYLPKAVTWSADPVLVFQAPDGTYRFPGDASGQSAHNYEQLGYTRVEIRGAVEMRGFERKMNRQEYETAARKVEDYHRRREMREHAQRSELRRKMQHMSVFGRAVANAAMAKNDAKPLKRASDAGFHSEAYSNDRSNRSESRDAQGRRRRD